MKAIATASAKAILVGEHAVVYGEPAIAMPVRALRCEAVVEPCYEGRSRLRSDRHPSWVWLDEADRTPLALLAEALRDTLEHLDFCPTGVVPFQLDLNSKIPAGSGLGSSAAVSVATVRALAEFLLADLDDETLRHIATKAEGLAHGVSSGLDPSTVALDRPIWFVRGQDPEPLSPRRELVFVVADSGIRASTQDVTGSLRDFLAADPRQMDRIRELGAIASAMRIALEACNEAAMGRLMDRAHAELQALGLSCPELDTLVEVARAAGALGAKLTGAGRGGALIALVSAGDSPRVAEALREAGAPAAWITTL